MDYLPQNKVKNKKRFLDLKVNVFENKNNGQMTITLPKRKLKMIMNPDDHLQVPKKIPIRVFKWGKK